MNLHRLNKKDIAYCDTRQVRQSLHNAGGRVWNVILFLLALVLFFSCKKNDFISNPAAGLSTSTSRLKFDTVFTSTGSTTQFFKINNPNTQRLLLSSIKLMGGAASPYRININGLAAPEASNIELAAGDSMYVFVTVTVNPNLATLPFLVEDSVQIQYNGNTRYVNLEAFGQNANFLRDAVITSDRTWNSALPYVILGQLQVDTGITLSISEGARIYCQANAPILVDGRLLVNGSKEKPVLFAGSRLDEEYRDLPASWPGIYCRQSSGGNRFVFAQVKNAYQAIVAEGPSTIAAPKISISQCIVDNAYDAGIIAVASHVEADNTLISNCGQNMSVLLGGSYLLTNCTLAAYSAWFSHKKPVLTVSNAATVAGSVLTNSIDAQFVNCIFWGEEGQVESEIAVNKQGTDPFAVSFTHCLFRAPADPINATVINGIRNLSPQFDSIDVPKRKFDFRIGSATAPGINRGIAVPQLFDLSGNPRSNGLPDLGCYEKQ
jgi:hypothetical protein